MRLRPIYATSCKDVLLSTFLDCLLDKNLEGMVREKGLLKPKKEELEAAWTKVYSEYGELLQSDESANYLTLIRQKIYTENRIYLTSVLIESLMIRYNEQTVKALKSMGYNFKFTKEKLFNDLKKVHAKVKQLQLELKTLEKQLVPLMQNGEINRADFMEALAVLGKHQGYRLDPKEITVSEYITILNNFKKWHQVQRSPK